MNPTRGSLMRAVTQLLCILALSLSAACAGPTAPPARGIATPRAPLTPTAEARAAPTATTALATTPSPTPPSELTPTASPTASAQSTASPASAGPAQPLRAWAVAPEGGAVFVLDAAGRLYRLAPGSLAVERVSPPLFDAAGEGPAYVVDGGPYLLVGDETASLTLVLNREDFRQVAAWDRAGPMAADPGRHVFMAWERGLWAYELGDPTQPPMVVTEAPLLGLGAVPVGLAADPITRQLYVTYHQVDASAPHQRETFRVYNLDAPAQTRELEPLLGTLARLAFASKAGQVVSVLNAKNGLPGSRLLIYDGLTAQARTSLAPLDGVAVTDAEGRRIYLLRERGLWVLDGNDLALLAVLPFTGTPPRDLAFAPDGETLYLFGDGWLAARPARELESLGIAPVSGTFPLAWAYPERDDFYRARLFRSPTWEADGTAFALVGGYGETYRTTDRGRTWQFLPALTYPDFANTQQLSLSPDFAADHTLTAHPAMLRSTDAGDTWQPSEPRIAFVSDRDGNREIYTAGPQGQEPRRVTANPAEDANPAWSPAWARIAFQSQRSGNWDIFTVRADCDASAPDAEQRCDLQQLTDNPADDMLPAWSPDGRQIAFVSTRDGNPEIYVMPAVSGERGEGTVVAKAVRLTDDPSGDWRPAWEPDGVHLVFTSGRGGTNGIYRLVVPAGAGAEAIPQPSAVVTGTADNRDPAVSRDGVLLFLSDRDGVMRSWELDMRYQGVPARPLSDDVRPEGHPAWIDDGIGWALVSLEEGGATGIYRATLSEHNPVIVSPAYNEQPAWGPALWRPPAMAGSE